MSLHSNEEVTVDTTEVCCDGGGGALGHPKIFLNIGKEGQIDCPYCGKTFILKAKQAG